MHGQDGSINANMATDMKQVSDLEENIHGRNRFMIATLQARGTHHKAFHGITR